MLIFDVVVFFQHAGAARAQNIDKSTLAQQYF